MSLRRPLLAAAALLALAGTAVLAQTPRFEAMRVDQGTENRSYDLQKTVLDLKLDEQRQSLEGTVTHLLQPLRDNLAEIPFDLVDLQITGAMVNGELAPYSTRENRVYVQLPPGTPRSATCEVSLEYFGEKPRRGLWFIQPDESDPDLHPEIWSQGQTEDNRHWIPTWDYPTDRATFEAYFTVRENLDVVSNGSLIEVVPAGEGWQTWHYALDFPFPSYLISVCVSDYERYVDRWRDIDVEYWVHQGVGEETARRSFGVTPAVLEFFSEFTGLPYPYPKYSQVAVQNFIYGGMENISATTQTDRTLHDARQALDQSSTGLVAHEAAHQWFGDYVTCRTWRHLWLNEGFATYFEALFERHQEGEDAFRLNMDGNQRSAVQRDRPDNTRPIVESFFSRADSGGGNNHVYVKGSSVLYMIHRILGEEDFRRSIHHYLSRHAGQLVDTEDLEVAIEEATGQNLHWLFEQFVYLPGHPQFVVRKSYDEEKHEVVLSVQQVQDLGPMVPTFRYPVPIEVTCAGSTELHTVWIDQREQEVRLPAPTAPLMVRFDKGSALLKTLDFEKSAAEWAYQATHDTDVVGRLRAVEQLADHPDAEAALAALQGVLQSQDHERVRARAAMSLGKFGAQAVAALHAGVQDAKSRVRAECLDQLGELAGQLADRQRVVAARAVDALQEDASYRVQAAAATALGKLGGEEAMAALRKASWYESPDDQVARQARLARIALEDGTAVDEIFAMMANPDDATTRQSGMSLAGSLTDKLLGERKSSLVEQLLQVAGEDKTGMRRAAVASLGDLAVIESEPLLRRLQDESDGDRRLRFVLRSALRKIERAKEEKAKEEEEAAASATEPALDAVRLQQTIEEMAQELRTLRERVKALEGADG